MIEMMNIHLVGRIDVPLHHLEHLQHSHPPPACSCMTIVYDQSSFWGVVFARAGSVFPKVLPRALLYLGPAILAITLGELYPKAMTGGQSEIMLPFQMLVAVMTMFRLNDAIGKYNEANSKMLELHSSSRKLLTRLSCYLPRTVENDTTLERIRRYIVLAAVLIKKHVRVENDFHMELACGLLTKAEHTELTCTMATIANQPGGNGKANPFPSRNRPAWAFTKIQEEIADLFRAGSILSPPHCNGTEQIVEQMSDNMEQVELIALTVVPLPYTQLTRWVGLMFLLLLPFDLASGCGVLTEELRHENVHAARAVIICFTGAVSLIANMIYFGIDQVSTELEEPFGVDANDIDIEDMIRRIDKHLAAQLSLRFKRPVSNFDLYSKAHLRYKPTDKWEMTSMLKGNHTMQSLIHIIGGSTTAADAPQTSIVEKRHEVRDEVAGLTVGKRVYWKKALRAAGQAQLARPSTIEKVSASACTHTSIEQARTYAMRVDARMKEDEASKGCGPLLQAASSAKDAIKSVVQVPTLGCRPLRVRADEGTGDGCRPLHVRADEGTGDAGTTTDSSTVVPATEILVTAHPVETRVTDAQVGATASAELPAATVPSSPVLAVAAAPVQELRSKPSSPEPALTSKGREGGPWKITQL